MTLTIHRSHERAATLSGSADIIDRVATLSGLVSRECVDDRLRAIDDPSERVLLAALAKAGVDPVVPTCALCDSQKRGRCCAHREASS